VENYLSEGAFFIFVGKDSILKLLPNWVAREVVPRGTLPSNSTRAPSLHHSVPRGTRQNMTVSAAEKLSIGLNLFAMKN
jgi:hypothetical protein